MKKKLQNKENKNSLEKKFGSLFLPKRALISCKGYNVKQLKYKFISFKKTAIWPRIVFRQMDKFSRVSLSNKSGLCGFYKFYGE